MAEELRVPWAVNSEGRLVNVSAAKNGFQRTLFCPACRWNLIVRKGVERRHHFAHPAGAACSQERLYHELAKKLLKERVEKTIAAEEEFVVSPRCLQCGHSRERIYSLNTSWRVEDEWSPVGGTVRADVALLETDQVAVVFEIHATHETSTQAREWYEENKCSVYELSALSERDLEDIERENPLGVLCLVSAERCDGCWALGIRKKAKPSAKKTPTDSCLPMGKAIWIRATVCFRCGGPFRVALGTVDRKLLKPEYFSKEEECLAIAAGANLRWLEIATHKQMPEFYPPAILANCCPNCGDHRVDFGLEHLVREMARDPEVLPIWRDSAGLVVQSFL